VFTAGFTPIAYKVFTVAAGVLQVDVGIFLLCSGSFRAIFFAALLLWKFGTSIKMFIERYFNRLSMVLVVLLFLGFMIIKLVL
jgi:hypothetical protein